MLKETYVSLEVAKLLKEKGFNEKCRGGYHYEFDDNDNSIVMLEEWAAQPYNNDFVDEGFLCSAPTHQMAMAWLREMHKLHIGIVRGPSGYHITIETIPFGVVEYITREIVGTPYVDSYEEAVEAALKYTLENLI